MKFNLSLSHHPKTILKVNSVLRIVPQLSIYDVHRVHFGRLGDLNLPRLRSKLTLCLQPYLRYRYMTFGRLYDRIIPRLCSKLTLCLQPYLRYRYMTFGRLYDRIIPRLCSKLTRFLESYLIYRYRSLGRSPSIRTILFRAARFDRAMPITGTADNPQTTRARLIIYLMLSAVPVCTQRRMRVRSAVASQRIGSG
jgi:hypothetical protein